MPECAPEPDDDTHNAAIIYDDLARLGIARIKATYSGSGDSGMVDDVIAFNAKLDPIILTDTAVTRSIGDHAPRAVPLKEAIEHWCYELLDQHHGGWEINDGSDGEFLIDVRKRTAKLVHTAYWQDSTTTSTKV